MPGNIPKAASKRREITAQETFRYTTPDMKVTARPVDAFVQPGKPQAKDYTELQGLVSALGQLSQVMQSKKQQWDKEAYEKGQVMALKGEEPPPGSPEAMWKGNQNFKGQASMIDLQTKYEEYLQQNQNATPAEFQAGLHKISQEHMAGQSDQYLVGMLKGGALGLEKQVMNAYRKTAVKNFNEDTTSAMATAFAGQFNTLQDKSPEAIHAMFTTFQDQAVRAGIPRKAATDRLLDVIGPLAVQSGQPELMRFAHLKDSKGVAVAMTDSSEKVLSYMKQAESSKDRIEANSLRDFNQRKKEAQDFAATEFWSSLYALEPGDTQFRGKASALITELERNKHNLDSNDYVRIRGKVEEIMDKGGFPKESNREVLAEAMMKAYAGELTNPTELLLSGALNVPNFKEVMSIQNSASQKMTTHRYSESVSQQRAMLKSGMDSVTGPKNMMGTYPDGFEKRQKLFQDLFLPRIEEARYGAEQSGGYIPFDVIKDIRDRTIQDVFKEHGDPTAPTAPSAQKAAGTQSTSTGPKTGAPVAVTGGQKPSGEQSAQPMSVRDRLLKLKGQ